MGVPTAIPSTCPSSSSWATPSFLLKFKYYDTVSSSAEYMLDSWAWTCLVARTCNLLSHLDSSQYNKSIRIILHFRIIYIYSVLSKHSIKKIQIFIAQLTHTQRQF